MAGKATSGDDSPRIRRWRSLNCVLASFLAPDKKQHTCPSSWLVEGDLPANGRPSPSAPHLSFPLLCAPTADIEACLALENEPAEAKDPAVAACCLGGIGEVVKLPEGIGAGMEGFLTVRA